MPVNFSRFFFLGADSESVVFFPQAGQIFATITTFEKVHQVFISNLKPTCRMLNCCVLTFSADARMRYFEKQKSCRGQSAARVHDGTRRAPPT